MAGSRLDTNLAHMVRFPGYRLARAVLLVLTGLGTVGSGLAGAAEQEAADALASLVAELEEADDDGRTIADVSLAAEEADVREARERLARLEAIDTASLEWDDQLTAAVLRWMLEAEIARIDTYWYSSPLMPAISPMRGALGRAQSMPLDGQDARERYLSFLQEATRSLAEILEKERGRAARSIVLPDEQIDRVLPYWRALAAHDAAHPLAPSGAELAALEPSIRAAFEPRWRAALREVAVGAQAIVDYLEGTLRDLAPNTVGMSQYPGGRRAYRVATRLMTTLDVTPEQVHEVGLAAVERINGEMAEVRTRLGFEGTKAEFHALLREDPRFYVDTPDAFGARLMEYDARVRPHMDDFFLREPEVPYGVRRLDPSLEASLTYGFYDVPTDDDPTGYYNYNGSRLSERSLLSGAALTYHELIPGHHYQIALARENTDLPAFRRNGYYSGYGEGWGEYSSSVVAREMGLYDDPYDLYGRLVFDMFFAVRLVVDTGMNYFGWSRPRAMLYMREHTMESDTQIDSETIRYSMRSPAQALAYYMGRDTWLRLRGRAERELGDSFDVRRFHDTTLSIGSVPLVVLERHVDRWIAQQLEDRRSGAAHQR